MRTLPGDELAPYPAIQSTRAITIAAPPSAVWPWIVQMGQGRGGLYSYERLEKMAGSQIRNANRITPEWQNLKAGDSIHLDQRQPALPVHAMEDARYVLYLASDGAKDGAAGAATAMPDGYYKMSWLFYLEPGRAANTTRLIIRTHTEYKRKPTSIII